MPIYLVKGPAGERLVSAEQKATAINHVIRDSITAEPVTATQLVDLMQSGLTVEKVPSKDLPKSTEAPAATPAAKQPQGENADV